MPVLTNIVKQTNVCVCVCVREREREKLCRIELQSVTLNLQGKGGMTVKERERGGWKEGKN